MIATAVTDTATCSPAAPTAVCRRARPWRRSQPCTRHSDGRVCATATAVHAAGVWTNGCETAVSCHSNTVVLWCGCSSANGRRPPRTAVSCLDSCRPIARPLTRIGPCAASNGQLSYEGNGRSWGTEVFGSGHRRIDGGNDPIGVAPNGIANDRCGLSVRH